VTPTPRFSVVIPAFDAERTVVAAIRSVRAQTEPDFELIVVDDGSRDATADRVRQVDDRRIRLLRQENRGLSAARNAGIGAARGSLIAFLDADDLWLPTYLERMGAALAARPEAELAYCDAWVFEAGTGRIRRQTFFDRHRPAGSLPLEPAAFLLVHLRDNFFYVGTTVRARAFASVGGFREDMTSLEDYEMWLRIEAAGGAIVEVAVPLALYRTSPGQMSANTPRMAANLAALCDHLEARDDLPAGARRLIAARRREALTVARPGLTRARAIAGAVRHALPPGRMWRPAAPAVVAEAFPDLARL
jgi:glycosyltransferase involved in cell wall biosynthesis